MQKDLIGYDDIIENSMRLVIYETLKKIEKTGLPGSHYFVIVFATRFPGVVLPKSLKEKYPDEMTIVVQYQYKTLVVEHDSFKISLSFNGKYEKLTVPYRAITSFSDPAMSFSLRFSVNYDDIEMMENGNFGDSNRANKNESKKNGSNNVDLSAKVVSLDAFRKNKNQNNDSDS
jgi:hypothetical protein